METFEIIPPTASRPRNLRSRITNGADILRGIDGRSADARRYRDLVEAFSAEYGLGSSERATLDLALKTSGLDQAKVIRRPRLLSDNGSSYIAADLAKWLDGQNMEPVRGAPYHPMLASDAQEPYPARKLLPPRRSRSPDRGLRR